MESGEARLQDGKWRRVKWWLAGFFLLLVAGAIVALRFLPAMGVQREIEAIRLAGLPASPAELDRWHTNVPSPRNAALVVEEALRLRVQPKPDADPFNGRLGSLSAGRPVLPGLRSAIAGYVAENQGAIAKLHEAAERPRTRYPADFSRGFNTLLPHLADVKGCVQLLKLEAADAALAGEAERAVEAIRSALALAAGMRQEPLLISGLVGIACTAIAISGLELVLSEIELDDGQLAEVGRMLREAEADSRQGLFRSVVGERAMGIGMFDVPVKEMMAFSGPGAGGPQDFLRAAGFHAWRVLGVRERDLRIYLDSMEELVQATTNDLPEALVLAKAAEARMDKRLTTGMGRFAMLTRMLMPSIHKCVQKEGALAGQLRCAQAAAAVERYRLEKGRLPAGLEQLVPDYLRAVPRDPFDEQALEYQAEADGTFRIISHGASASRQKAGSVSFAVLRGAAAETEGEAAE